MIIWLSCWKRERRFEHTLSGQNFSVREGKERDFNYISHEHIYEFLQYEVDAQMVWLLAYIPYQLLGEFTILLYINLEKGKGREEERCIIL